MSKFAGIPLLWLIAAVFAAAEPPPASAPAAQDPRILHADQPAAKKIVYVIPIQEMVAPPMLYILRRGLKEAIAQKADAVVLDMDTTGGRGDVALEMMEALEKFPNLTVTFINRKAGSAGAFIAAATQEIWFEPKGVIGAAAAVTSTGEDLPETMRLKINSFLRGEIRANTEGKGYRGQVIEAMIDKDYELKIGDKLIKPKGELLSRTATEAMEKFGDPPQPLLGAGIAVDVDDLLTKKFGAGNYTLRRFEVTWSEHLARYLTAIAPVLLGLGLLALFIEFKMPGHGWIGGIGVVLLALFFFGHHVAGLSGHEPIVVFALGLVMLAVEIFFFPGVFVLAAAGLVLMLAALLWSMADLWPNEPISISGGAFAAPLGSLALGLAIAVVAGIVLVRYLPKGWVWDKLVLAAAVDAAAQTAGTAPESAVGLDALVGQRGIAATALRPSGQVEVAGRRFEAKVEVGAIDAGASVVVRGRTDFGLVVEKAET